MIMEAKLEWLKEGTMSQGVQKGSSNLKGQENWFSPKVSRMNAFLKTPWFQISDLQNYKISENKTNVLASQLLFISKIFKMAAFAS